MGERRAPPHAAAAGGAELPEFFRYLGITVERVGREEAVLRMHAPSGLLSPYGPVHGGAIAALIDTAFGVAVACHLSRHDRTATHELNINYISFARHPEVVATARVLRVGRTVAHTEAEVRTVDGTLIAKALATFGVIRRPA